MRVEGLRLKEGQGVLLFVGNTVWFRLNGVFNVVLHKLVVMSMPC